MSDEGAGAFLARLTAKLAAAGVPNMVVGSFASSFHGIPRSSQDLDLVIDPQRAVLLHSHGPCPFPSGSAETRVGRVSVATRWQRLASVLVGDRHHGIAIT
jgi:hypothetical protein